jgi:hypothetical protein
MAVSVSALDYREIENLKGKYFRSVDSKDWSALRGLYVDDAQFEGFVFDAATPDVFVSGVADFLTGALSIHHGCNPELRALTKDLVRGVWAMHDIVVWPAGSRSYKNICSPHLSGIEGYGHYEEEYRRTIKGWRISLQRLTRLRVEPLMGEASGLSVEGLRGMTPHWMEWE